MKAPFVWFGGKRKVAPQVWEALGDVDNYVEPFAGSLAVLLNRPHRLDDGKRRAETVNDADGFVANVWRALKHSPDDVAYHCSDPVNETDLFARHLWLVNTGRERIANLENDPEWHDPKVAGWWLWGVNAWIGSGWCSGNGPWVLGAPGEGGPHLGNAGQGVHRNRPHLGNAGQGVHRVRAHLGDAGKAGFNNLDLKPQLRTYFAALQRRLADVRVCAGDWSRVATKGALSYGATVGVFLDPPYLGDVRYSDLYSVDDHTIADDVRAWCIDNGDNPRLRIVLAGYADEHDHLIPPTWRRHRYTANAAYSTSATAAASSGNHQNRTKEVLWFSPHCIDPKQGSLW